MSNDSKNSPCFGSFSVSTPCLCSAPSSGTFSPTTCLMCGCLPRRDLPTRSTEDIGPRPCGWTVPSPRTMIFIFCWVPNSPLTSAHSALMWGHLQWEKLSLKLTFRLTSKFPIFFSSVGCLPAYNQPVRLVLTTLCRQMDPAQQNLAGDLSVCMAWPSLPPCLQSNSAYSWRRPHDESISAQMPLLEGDSRKKKSLKRPDNFFWPLH